MLPPFIIGDNNIMKMCKNGIYRTVEDNEVKEKEKQGFKKSSCFEPQPSQEGLYVIDDYTIAKKDMK